MNLGIVAVVLVLAPLQERTDGETLYNGIRLPAAWRPKIQYG